MVISFQKLTAENKAAIIGVHYALLVQQKKVGNSRFPTLGHSQAFLRSGEWTLYVPQLVCLGIM